MFTNNQEPCSDGNACTLADTCEEGVCIGGGPPECDDSNPCTVDTCKPAVGCQNTDNTSPCNDGNACTQETPVEVGRACLVRTWTAMMGTLYDGFL